VLLVGLVLGTGAAVVAAAEPAPWDEKRILKLTSRLVIEVDAIKTGIAREWERADKSSARYIVLNDLMMIQPRVVAFEGLVRAGQGRDKTEPVFRRIQDAVENAREDAQKYPAVRSQSKRIDTANAILEELGTFYGEP